MLWWIANIVLLAVVAPVVVRLAHGVYRRTARIADLTARIGTGGLAVHAELKAAPELLATRDLVRTARGQVNRYGGALQRALSIDDRSS
ncbi:MAG: hypothetical protein ACRD0N_14720 [Acidimicrobiales bacterium]